MTTGVLAKSLAMRQSQRLMRLVRTLCGASRTWLACLLTVYYLANSDSVKHTNPTINIFLKLFWFHYVARVNVHQAQL